MAHAGDAYLATIRQVIYARSTALATRELLVQLSQLGNRAGVIGAASMVLDELFSDAAAGPLDRPWSPGRADRWPQHELRLTAMVLRRYIGDGSSSRLDGLVVS